MKIYAAARLQDQLSVCSKIRLHTMGFHMRSRDEMSPRGTRYASSDSWLDTDAGEISQWMSTRGIREEADSLTMSGEARRERNSMCVEEEITERRLPHQTSSHVMTESRKLEW